MKRIQKPLIFTTLIVGLVAVGAATLYFAWPKQTTMTASPIVPTKTIDHSQAIGGKPDTSAKSDDKAAATAPTTSASQSTQNTSAALINPAKEPTTEKMVLNYDNAPAQSELKKTVDVEHTYRALGTVPNDPMYTNFTDKNGYQHTPFALQHLGAPTVWDTTTGSPIVVADIDTGFALDHEDLKTQWWQNANETGTTTLTADKWGYTCKQGVDKSANGCDDDGNGYVDDWRGWNFYGSYKSGSTTCNGRFTPNNNPMAGATNDNTYFSDYSQCHGVALDNLGDPFEGMSHGTSTAGIVGAASNNSIGIATLNWNVKIMPLQVLGDNGSGSTSGIAAAVRYAVDNGAQVINMSLGGSSDDTALRSAVDYAYSKNVIIVAAAGNCGTGKEAGCDPAKPGAMGYPALNDHVIAVGATDVNDTRASFSSYGPGLDVVAPGYGQLISPLISRPYDSTTGQYSSDPTTFNYTNAYSSNLAGTSFSSPYTANVVSLIKSVKPNYTIDDVTALVDATAKKVSAMNGAIYTTQYGHGLVNATAIATIAKTLASESDAPVLAQTGNYISEHTFGASDMMSSGCTVSANAYCTIWLHDNITGYDRYLPYTTTATGRPGWSWNSNILVPDEWSVRAVQGAARSNSYLLFRK